MLEEGATLEAEVGLTLEVWATLGVTLLGVKSTLEANLAA